MVLYLVVFVLFGYVYEDSDSLIVDNDSLIICGNHQYNIKVHITNSGKLKVRQWDYADSTGWLLLNAPLISIEDSSLIYGSQRGYWGGSTTHPDGFGPGYGSAGPGGGGGGAGYGGDGGDGGDLDPGSGGSSYGDSGDTLIDIGSGGGAGRLGAAVDGWGGDGGAKVYLRAQKVIIDSSFIESNGQNGNEGYEAGGGGSGGGILIRADSVVIHYTESRANGGNGGEGIGGGGGGAGGGRIKIFYVSHLDTSNLSLSVLGGAGGLGGFGNGEPGTSGSTNIGPVVGIEEIVREVTLRNVIKSNPVRNRVKITVENVPIHLRLFDVSGRVAKTFWLKNNTQFIDLHDLRQGIYFLKSKEEGKFIGKIILLK